MLKRVEPKKCTIHIRHQYEAVPKIQIDAQYGFLALSCDCAKMDSVQLKILPSANGNFTL